MTKELPLTIAALVAIGLLVVLPLGAYLGLVVPVRREIARLGSELPTLSARLAVTAAPPLPITASERASERQIESSLKERFPPVEDQLRVVAEATDHARAAGLMLTDVAIVEAILPPSGQVGAPPVVTPPGLTANPGTIQLVAQHRYRELVDFLDLVGRSRTYIAVQGFDVRRVDDRLESQIRLVSLRWQP